LNRLADRRARGGGRVAVDRVFLALLDEASQDRGTRKVRGGGETDGSILPPVLTAAV
jgi:hypothetical protein